MKIDKFKISSCCGSKTIIYKTETLDVNLIDKLSIYGFKESKHFTKAGLFYVSNNDLILSGVIGGTKLQVKCLNKFCDKSVENFEKIIDFL